jgi:hypothetical protein
MEVTDDVKEFLKEFFFVTVWPKGTSYDGDNQYSREKYNRYKNL